MAGGDERLVQPDGALRAGRRDPRGGRFELAGNGEGRLFGDVAAWPERFLNREFDGGRSPDDFVEPVGTERGIIAKVEVDVTLERAIGVERGPAAAAHVIALVGALPRELDARPAITIRVAAVEFSRHRDEAQTAETVLIELDEAGLDQVDGLLIPIISVTRHRPMTLLLPDMRRE
jgi:hypothetical protein